VHDEAFDGGFWIVAVLVGGQGPARQCLVFRTNRGNRRHYVGAGNTTRYVGGCQCGAGH
jgi:hypothetical protein